MRIILPHRIPMYSVGIFAALLFLMQQVDHTTHFFSICCFLFILISGITFNLAGGLTTPSGGYVFFYAMLTVIVGLVWKVVQGEPADSNLLEPRLTILTYLGGICAMCAAVIVSRRFTRSRPLLSNVSNLGILQAASIGCLAFGVFLYLLQTVVAQGTGTVLSALMQVNRFNELAILLGVTYQIRKSGGRSSINTSAAAATLVLWVHGGLLQFSKQAMFTPFICWALAAGAQGYYLSRKQIFGGVVFLWFLLRFMVPYAQYGRSQQSETLGGNLSVSFKLLSDLGTVRARYENQERANLEESRSNYYNRPQGLFDRLQMMYPDSTLVEETERLGPFGLYPMVTAVENLVPHFLWPGKPTLVWGNFFSHQALVPGLADEDDTTGISFSPTGEAYRLEGFAGVLLLAPIVWIALFVWFDSLCGDVRASPWGLLALTVFAHTAPEGMLDGPIYLMVNGAFAIIFAALSATYVMPHLGRLVAGPGSRNQEGSAQLRGLPRRVSTLGGTEPTGA